MQGKKYRITRATLRYEDNRKDIIQSSIYTNDIEAERKRIKKEYKCKGVDFRINENYGKLERVKPI